MNHAGQSDRLGNHRRVAEDAEFETNNENLDDLGVSTVKRREPPSFVRAIPR
jgi:hypothetical protein